MMMMPPLSQTPFPARPPAQTQTSATSSTGGGAPPWRAPGRPRQPRPHPHLHRTHTTTGRRTPSPGPRPVCGGTSTAAKPSRRRSRPRCRRSACPARPARRRRLPRGLRLASPAPSRGCRSPSRTPTCRSSVPPARRGQTPPLIRTGRSSARSRRKSRIMTTRVKMRTRMMVDCSLIIEAVEFYLLFSYLRCWTGK